MSITSLVGWLAVFPVTAYSPVAGACLAAVLLYAMLRRADP